VVSKQVIKILIEAEEEVSKVAKKAENALNKMGEVGSKVMNGINNASSKVHGAFDKVNSYVDRAREKFNEFANSGNKLGNIRRSITNTATSFGRLITGSNTAAMAMNKLKSVSDGVKAKFTSLQGKIRSVGSSIDSLKAKLRNLSATAKSTGSGGFGFLKNAASMTAGMLGYDLVNSIVQTTKASLNARASIQQFGSRLRMSASEVNTFQKSLDELQSTYKKVDMDVVGQTAMDMAYRLQLPKSSLTELTETTAIFTDAMARNGRTSEDAMLAMADAMDGQFRRLQEIGLSEEALMRNGWSGDLQDKEGLLKAMNKALKEQHYDVLAQSIDTLDDAWNALSITLSNLLESIILPIMPALLMMVSYISDAVNKIKAFVPELQKMWSNLPEWAKIAIIIGGVALAVGVLIAAFGGLESILISILAPIGAFIAAFSWPVVAIVAIIGLLVAAIYEVGKAFGWWSDVNTMLAAIGAGLQMMWSAFINHPDVQAAISAIGWALQELGGFITWAGQKVLEFFGVSTGSNWDVVRAIIDGIGQVWNNLTSNIRFVISILQALYNFVVPIGQAIYEALKPIVCILLGCSPGIVPALRMVYDVFVEVWNQIMSVIGPIISVIVTTVQQLVNVFEQFKNGQISLPTLIFMVLSILWNAYSTIFTKIIQLVMQFASKLLSRGISAARNFVNGIINWLSQLPGRAYSQLIAVVGRITSAGSQWVSHARQKASEVVTGAVNTLSELPGKISGALSGVVNAIVQPFRQAYDDVVGVVNNIKSQVEDAMNYIGSLGSAGSDAAGGEMTYSGSTLDIKNSVGWKQGKVEVESTQKLILDLENVPAHIDTQTLINMLNDSEVIKALTHNKDFQSLDSKMKAEIQSRARRARGA